MNNTEKKISKGVYTLPSGNYRMRKQINGKTISKVFTNKAKAIKAYKELSK